ncbi:MAG: peptide chain release factor-like protein, partial [Candidatus Omnitrophota bacterium]
MTSRLFPVSERKNESLARAMESLGIRETDLQELFIRSGGPGGQNVNKVSTCVVLKHLASGIVVKCQQERTQSMNRYWARRILVDRLDERIRGRQSAEAQRIAKIKRQKRKRSKRAKDKMLEAKRAHGEKKQLRGRIDGAY